MSYHLMFNQVTPYLPLLLKGLLNSVILACVGMLIGALVGMVIGIVRMGNMKVLRYIANVYVEVVRNTPLLIQMYLIYFGLPQFNIMVSPTVTAVIALILNNGAYAAVIFQSGYKAVDVGQGEAAVALGMTSAQNILYITIPQALRIVVGPLTNQFISMFLFTSVASTVSVRELLTETLYVDSISMRTFEVFIITTLLYLFVTTVITLISNFIESRKKY
ncbi:MAG: amino acid ABC transporter permease [Sporomusa sp.]